MRLRLCLCLCVPLCVATPHVDKRSGGHDAGDGTRQAALRRAEFQISPPRQHVRSVRDSVTCWLLATRMALCVASPLVAGQPAFTGVHSRRGASPLTRPPPCCRTQRGGLSVTARQPGAPRVTAATPLRSRQVVHSAAPLVTPAASTPDRGVQRPQHYNGVFLLLLLNVLVFAADAWVPGLNVKQLYLHHSRPHWYQFLTSAFCHANFEHLNGNLFMLLVFGKAVEQEEGFAGVWLSYILCGIGASIASYLLMPSSTGGLLGGSSVVSLGASGAVFGLFTISVLVKLTAGADWRKLLESAILGSFVVDKVWNEVAITASGTATGGVNHVAHLAGALCGVLLIWALQNAFPKQEDARE